MKDTKTSIHYSVENGRSKMDIANIVSKASIQKGETWIIQIELVKTCRRRLGKSSKGARCTTLIFPARGGFKSIACFALRQIQLLINLTKIIQIFYRQKIS